MKIIVFTDNYGVSAGSDTLAWYLVADSALINTGKPFFIPDDAGVVTATLLPALKITRLGKSVNSKFASRYLTEWAPALHFRLKTLEGDLCSRNLPISAAVSFDRSLFCGEFSPIGEDFKVPDLEMRLNGELCMVWKSEELVKSPSILLEKFSEMNTVKMGDLLIPGGAREIQVRGGDYLEIIAPEHKSFSVKIK